MVRDRRVVWIGNESAEGGLERSVGRCRVARWMHGMGGVEGGWVGDGWTGKASWEVRQCVSSVGSRLVSCGG